MVEWAPILQTLLTRRSRKYFLTFFFKLKNNPCLPSSVQIHQSCGFFRSTKQQETVLLLNYLLILQENMNRLWIPGSEYCLIQRSEAVAIVKSFFQQVTERQSIPLRLSLSMAAAVNLHSRALKPTRCLIVSEPHRNDHIHCQVPYAACFFCVPGSFYPPTPQGHFLRAFCRC